MPINIIDFEASALTSPCFPIQVAVIKSDGSTYDAFIRPSDNWLGNYVWDPESEKIHNTPIQLLLDVGKSIEDVARELNEFIDGEDVYCDGGSYDRMWADELYNAALHSSRRFEILDIKDILAIEHWVQFWSVKQRAVAILKLKEHDALNDVKIIQQAAEWCLTETIPRMPRG